MRTTLKIDEGLLDEVMALTEEGSKSKAVCRALKEYAQLKRTEQLITLFGTVKMPEDWRVLRDGELGEGR